LAENNFRPGCGTSIKILKNIVIVIIDFISLANQQVKS
jgi:hypothetical protein